MRRERLSLMDPPDRCFLEGLIRRRLLDVIYDKNVCWSLARFQFEAKLFLRRCEKRWPRGVHLVLDAPPSILAPGGAALAELSRGCMTGHTEVTFFLEANIVKSNRGS